MQENISPGKRPGSPRTMAHSGHRSQPPAPPNRARPPAGARPPAAAAPAEPAQLSP